MQRSGCWRDRGSGGIAARNRQRRSVGKRRGGRSVRTRHKSRAGNLGYGVLWRNEPSVPRIAMNGPLRTAHGIRPTTQVKHRDEDLLTRNDRHIGVLVVVEVCVL